MDFWNWQLFLDQFAPPALAATAILGVLAMLARWAWNRQRKFIAGGIGWLMLLSFVLFVFMIAQPKSILKSERAYFTKSASRILSVSNDRGRRALDMTLVVSVKNNDRPASSVISQIMIFDNKLDPTIAPLETRRINSANDIGRFQPLNHRARVKISIDDRFAYIVYEIKYSDTLSGEVYSQIWFMKAAWLMRDGKLTSSFFEARHDERIKMEDYIAQRKIPTLVPRVGAD